MAKLNEVAKAYELKQTKNIADLEKVPVDIDVVDDEFEAPEKDANGNPKTDEQGNPVTKTVQQKVFEQGGEKYRIPNSVLKQLKVLLEDNPNLKYFKVKRSGQGLNTDYTVIPLFGNTDAPVEKPTQNQQ